MTAHCPECGAAEPDWNASNAFDARDEIIEECAQVATQLVACLRCGSDVTEKVAAAIRALKEKS